MKTIAARFTLIIILTVSTASMNCLGMMRSADSTVDLRANRAALVEAVQDGQVVATTKINDKGLGSITFPRASHTILKYTSPGHFPEYRMVAHRVSAWMALGGGLLNLVGSLGWGMLEDLGNGSFLVVDDPSAVQLESISNIKLK